MFQASFLPRKVTGLKPLYLSDVRANGIFKYKLTPGGIVKGIQMKKEFAEAIGELAVLDGSGVYEISVRHDKSNDRAHLIRVARGKESTPQLAQVICKLYAIEVLSDRVGEGTADSKRTTVSSWGGGIGEVDNSPSRLQEICLETDDENLAKAIMSLELYYMRHALRGMMEPWGATEPTDTWSIDQHYANEDVSQFHDSIHNPSPVKCGLFVDGKTPGSPPLGVLGGTNRAKVASLIAAEFDVDVVIYPHKAAMVAMFEDSGGKKVVISSPDLSDAYRYGCDTVDTNTLPANVHRDSLGAYTLDKRARLISIAYLVLAIVLSITAVVLGFVDAPDPGDKVLKIAEIFTLLTVSVFGIIKLMSDDERVLRTYITGKRRIHRIRDFAKCMTGQRHHALSIVSRSTHYDRIVSGVDTCYLRCEKIGDLAGEPMVEEEFARAGYEVVSMLIVDYVQDRVKPLTFSSGYVGHIDEKEPRLTYHNKDGYGGNRTVRALAGRRRNSGIRTMSRAGDGNNRETRSSEALGAAKRETVRILQSVNNSVQRWRFSKSWWRSLLPREALNQ